MIQSSATIVDNNDYLPTDQISRDVAVDPQHSVIVKAPAGSGKTGVLILRFLNCLAVSLKPEEVVAITFTNKASNEIRERVMNALIFAATDNYPTERHEQKVFDAARKVLARDEELGWNIIQSPSRLRIVTFDKHAASMARMLPIMSGIGGGQIEELPGRIYRQAVIELFSTLEDDSAPESLKAALEYVLSHAKNQIERVADQLNILLSKREQWVFDLLSMDAEEAGGIITEHVRGKLEELINELNGVSISGFFPLVRKASVGQEKLSWANSIPDFIAKADQGSLDTLRHVAGILLTQKGTFRCKLTAREGFPAKDATAILANAWLTNLKESPDAEAVERMLNELLVLPDVILPDAVNDYASSFIIVLKFLLAHLKVVFDREGKIDFQEMAFRAVSALGDDDTAIGDALLKEDRICHLLVDEMQDTSLLQYRVLEILCGAWGNDDGKSLFLCGDSQQSIYRFRNANVGNFIDLSQKGHFAGLPMKEVRLTNNFRSLFENVQWVNDTFSTVMDKDDDVEVGEVSYSPAEAFLGSGGNVHVHPFMGAGYNDEAQCVLEVIQDALTADAQQSIAVLVRGRTHLKEILPLLKEKGITFCGQDIDTVSDRDSVSQVLSIVRAMHHPADDVSWMSILRAPFVGLSWAECLVMSQHKGLLFDAITNHQLVDGLSADGKQSIAKLAAVLNNINLSGRKGDLAYTSKQLWFGLGGPACVDEAEYSDIERVFDLLSDFQSTNTVFDIDIFNEHVSRLFATPKPGVVQIMTIHKSKGLEFDTVIVPGLGRSSGSDDKPLFLWRRFVDGFAIAPKPLKDIDLATKRLYDYFSSLNSREQAAENKRLLYVATTRAKKTLHLLATIKSNSAAPQSNSLLRFLWPVLATHFDSAKACEVVEDLFDPAIPSIIRLPDINMHSNIVVGYSAAAGRASMPQESAEVDDKEVSSNMCERVIGIVYHRVLEFIAKSGLNCDIGALSSRVRSQLKRQGYPGTEIETGISTVIELITRTLNSPHGKWIMTPRHTTKNECAIQSYIGGRWQRLVMDRVFLEDNTVWVIDYKTAQGHKEMKAPAFIRGEKERYREKMMQYRDAVKLVHPDLQVKVALYFPAFDELACY
ncbi:MAG: UvrD-helicase domain-containing protein [Pseudomonadales bacterium]